jgi:hypothetical protein
MATFIPLYSGSLQRVQARGDQWSAGRAGVGPFPFALPSKRGDFAAYTRCDLNCVAKFPLLSGEVALIGHPEARVSRVTGKFDTTASQPKWQVGFCHLRGRNQQTEVLSVENSPKMPKRHSPVGRRLGTCTGHWPLNQVKWIVSTFCIRPAGFRSVALALAGFCVLSAAISNLAACYITGTLHIAIGWPFDCVQTFKYLALADDPKILNYGSENAIHLPKFIVQLWHRGQ